MAKHEVSDRTARKRIADVYKKLSVLDVDERRRSLALSRNAVRVEIARLKREIATLGGVENAKLRERVSSTMLYWEKWYLELHGVRSTQIEELLEDSNDEDDMPLSRDEALAELAADLSDEELGKLIELRGGLGAFKRSEAG